MTVECPLPFRVERPAVKGARSTVTGTQPFDLRLVSIEKRVTSCSGDFVNAVQHYRPTTVRIVV